MTGIHEEHRRRHQLHIARRADGHRVRHHHRAEFLLLARDAQCERGAEVHTEDGRLVRVRQRTGSKAIECVLQVEDQLSRPGRLKRNPPREIRPRPRGKVLGKTDPRSLSDLRDQHLVPVLREPDRGVQQDRGHTVQVRSDQHRRVSHDFGRGQDDGGGVARLRDRGIEPDPVAPVWWERSPRFDRGVEPALIEKVEHAELETLFLQDDDRLTLPADIAMADHTAAEDLG